MTDPTPLRQLTDHGIERARAFLADARQHPLDAVSPPADLLYDAPWSEPVADAPSVSPQRFNTRRDIADYLSPRIDPIIHYAADHAGVWSWLGMYYFRELLWDANGLMRTRNWPEDTVFIFDSPDGPAGRNRSYQRRYRHYLWSAWRLQQAHGDTAAFLLDRDPTEFSNLTSRALGYARIFNSVGVVPLMLRLYTEGARQKPKHRYGRGGLEHLIRVLDQLERTYDVYGMSAEALSRILPPDFDRWQTSPA